jgi:hypothetical protein
MKPTDASLLQASITRRTILKKTAYMTPVLLTLPAVPAFAASGSKKPKTRTQGELGSLGFDRPTQAPAPPPPPRQHHWEEDR